jgi:hypothetical protein
LRNDGIDLRKLMERADKEAKEQGKEEAEYDTMYWHPAALGSGKGQTGADDGYVVFTMADWDLLKGSEIRYEEPKWLISLLSHVKYY